MGAAVNGARARVPENQIPAGVHIGDLDLGGKTLDEARPVLEQWVSHRQSAQIALRCAPDTRISKVWKPDAAKVGLGVNIDGSLDAAAKAGRENIAGTVTHIFSGAKIVRVAAVPAIDETRLTAYLKRQIAADVFRKPKNAQFVLIKGGGFGTHHEQLGTTLDVEASAAAVKQAWTAYLSNTSSGTTGAGGQPAAEHTGDKSETPSTDTGTTTPSQDPIASDGMEAVLSVKTTSPALTSKDLDQIDTLLGAKSSWVGGTTSRLGNIRIAASHINGTLLKPGDVFSYNKIVGPRDEDEGYREAPILVRGKHDKGIAGGICQTSGTLFNAVLASGLKIVERSNHSTPIGYLPTGLDATVSYGSLDLKFKNDSEAPVYVAASLSGRSLTFSLFGKGVPSRKVSLVRGGFSWAGGGYQTQHDRTKPAGYRHVVEPASSGGHATWYRIIKQDGKVVRRDVISSHYSGHTGIVVVGAGPAKPRPVKRPLGAPVTVPGVSPGAGGPAPPPAGANQ